MISICFFGRLIFWEPHYQRLGLFWLLQCVPAVKQCCKLSFVIKMLTLAGNKISINGELRRFLKPQVGMFVFIPHWTLYRCLKCLWLGERSVILRGKTPVIWFEFSAWKHYKILADFLNKLNLFSDAICLSTACELMSHFCYHPLFALSRLLDMN